MRFNNKPCIGAPARRRLQGHAKGLLWALRHGGIGLALPSGPCSNGRSALRRQCQGLPAPTKPPAHPHQQRPDAAQATAWSAQPAQPWPQCPPATTTGHLPRTSHGQLSTNDSSTRLALSLQRPPRKAGSSDTTPARHRRK